MAKESRTHIHTNISVTDNWQKIIKAQNYGGAAIRQTSKTKKNIQEETTAPSCSRSLQQLAQAVIHCRQQTKPFTRSGKETSKQPLVKNQQPSPPVKLPGKHGKFRWVFALITGKWPGERVNKAANVVPRLSKNPTRPQEGVEAGVKIERVKKKCQ